MTTLRRAISLLAVLVGWTLTAAVAVAVSREQPEGDGFVRMIERQLSGAAHVQITPGVVLTLVECQCSVRYSGTTVHGNHYAVHLDKLD